MTNPLYEELPDPCPDNGLAFLWLPGSQDDISLQGAYAPFRAPAKEHSS